MCGAAVLAHKTFITGDALKLSKYRLPQVDYCITSPPYWDMLRARGAETQSRRRGVADLDVHYSDDPADVGNLTDYEDFLNALCEMFKHAVEAWKGGALAGGLYGVALRGAFFGESMFHRVPNASKVALVHLVDRLRSGEWRVTNGE